MLQAEDTAFLEWAEGGAGRAHIASELKVLRAAAAQSLVANTLSSTEGQVGRNARAGGGAGAGGSPAAVRACQVGGRG